MLSLARVLGCFKKPQLLDRRDRQRTNMYDDAVMYECRLGPVSVICRSSSFSLSSPRAGVPDAERGAHAAVNANSSSVDDDGHPRREVPRKLRLTRALRGRASLVRGTLPRSLRFCHAVEYLTCVEACQIFFSGPRGTGENGLPMSPSEGLEEILQMARGLTG